MAKSILQDVLKGARWIGREALKPEPLGMAAPGAQLAQRVRRMLSGSVLSRTSRVKLAAIAVACASVVIVFSTGTLVRAQQAVDASPKFEVASIRPASVSDSGGAGRSAKGKDGGGGPKGGGGRNFAAALNEPMGHR
ncbi:MAG: hypothetical protein ABI824_14070, partial [Acidobacteriota bacterium]